MAELRRGDSSISSGGLPAAVQVLATGGASHVGFSPRQPVDFDEDFLALAEGCGTALRAAPAATGTDSALGASGMLSGSWRSKPTSEPGGGFTGDGGGLRAKTICPFS